MNVQKGQFVQISFEAGCAEELALRAVEHAYRRGARHVHLAYSHPRVKRAQLDFADPEDRFFFQLYDRQRSEHIVDSHGCMLGLMTNPEPDLFEDMAILSGEHQAAQRRWSERFYKEGINKGKVAWCLACPPSPKWAAKVYPSLSEDTAYQTLWQAVFRMTMSDREDCIDAWEKLDAKLHERRRMLNYLQIRELHFTGPDTNLRVGLSSLSRWLGGTKDTAHGIPFTANVPSYEVFTTPDRRTANGFVRITKPLLLAGVLVEGLALEFRDGKVVEATAHSNEAAYQAHIAKDAGASFLGEVALVGMDSPVAQENTIFKNTLYDENAACHIATGSGYSMGLENGWNLSAKDLEEAGLNQSATHTDVMISDSLVSVDARTQGGDTVALMRMGHWVGEFA
jgi:aminopeptidase